MPEKISSTTNPKILDVLHLQQKSAERKRRNLMVVEGWREIQLALLSGCKVESLLICPERLNERVDRSVLDATIPANKKTEVTARVFEKLAYRESSDGLIAVMEPMKHTLSMLEKKENPLFVVLEAVEKPGNLGAVLRTADAAAVDAVIICDPLADLYNPNTIRSSIGCVFTVPVISCESSEAIAWFKSHQVKILSAALTASQWYHETDLKGPLALVMGTEATGLTEQWLAASDLNIKIPMRGEIDSLNVSVSTAVLVFEAMRQRGFEK